MTHTTTDHTPGPWYTANTSGDQGLICSERTGANIAVAYDKKDAALIAAAPDLLDVLTRLTEWACTYTSPTDANSPHDLLIQARAAISIVTEVRP